MISAAFSPQARRDLLEAVRWIAKDNPVAAKALRDGVAKLAGMIGEYPDVGGQRPDLADEIYRFIVVAGFPYVVVYNAESRPPLILRILHGARDLPEILDDLSPKTT